MRKMTLPDGPLGTMVDILAMEARGLGYAAVPLGYTTVPESGPYLIRLDDARPSLRPELRLPTRFVTLYQVGKRVTIWWVARDDDGSPARSRTYLGKSTRLAEGLKDLENVIQGCQNVS